MQGAYKYVCQSRTIQEKQNEVIQFSFTAFLLWSCI